MICDMKYDVIYNVTLYTMQRPWRNIDWQSAIIMWPIAQNEKVT